MPVCTAFPTPNHCNWRPSAPIARDEFVLRQFEAEIREHESADPAGWQTETAAAQKTVLQTEVRETCIEQAGQHRGPKKRSDCSSQKKKEKKKLNGETSKHICINRA